MDEEQCDKELLLRSARKLARLFRCGSLAIFSEHVYMCCLAGEKREHLRTDSISRIDCDRTDETDSEQ